MKLEPARLTKICIREDCSYKGKEQPFENFPGSAHTRDGKSNICKDCTNEIVSIRRSGPLVLGKLGEIRDIVLKLLVPPKAEELPDINILQQLKIDSSKCNIIFMSQNVNQVFINSQIKILLELISQMEGEVVRDKNRLKTRENRRKRNG